MSIFSRSSEVNAKLATWFIKAGWVSVALNMITLTWYFWAKYERAFWMIRISGCAAVSALILGVEFAALSVLLEPKVLEEFMGQNKTGNGVSDMIATVSIITVCGLAGLAFWYDWTINISAFRLETNNIDYQILAGVIVFISELFFWIANVCEMSASKSNSSSKSPLKVPPKA